MKCNDCPNSAFFKYFSENKKKLNLCPVCYINRFEKRLRLLPPPLQQIKKSLKKVNGIIEFYIPEKEKPVWTGVDHESIIN